MKRSSLILAMLAVSALALGQSADANSAGPTKNDYQLRVIEPAEGATISGPSVRVIVSTQIPKEVGARRDVNSMPRPQIAIFLDNEQKGLLKDDQNVMTVDNVSPGSHKLVLVAKNQSGEIIDRKEVAFTSTALAESSARVAAPPPEPARVAAPPPPQPAVQETTSTTTMTRASEPPPAPAPRVEEATTLPATASNAPLFAVAGLGLLVLGVALRRKS